jgi:natural product precursor
MNMNKLKLTKLAERQLSEKQMNAVIGGSAQGGYRGIYDNKLDTWSRLCGCSCAYESKGGSSTDDNKNANYNGGAKGLVSPGFAWNDFN